MPENPSTEYGVSAEKPKSRHNQILSNMKQLIKAAILLLCVLFSLQSYSQVKFGVKAGPSVTTIIQNFDDSDEEIATLPRILFTLGGVADIGFTDMISLQPGLLLSLKGSAVDVKEEYDATGYDRYTIAYLDIPINVAFKFGGFQLYAGPYLGIAVSGKDKWDLEGDGWDDKDSQDFIFVIGKADPEDFEENETGTVMKRFDYGIGLGAGYKLGPVLLGIGAEIGLANLTPDVKDVDFNPSDYKVHNLSASFTATFFFGD